MPITLIVFERPGYNPRVYAKIEGNDKHLTMANDDGGLSLLGLHEPTDGYKVVESGDPKFEFYRLLFFGRLMSAADMHNSALTRIRSFLSMESE